MENSTVTLVDNCPVCKPISELIVYLQENGFEIIEQKIEDFHFHQLYFKLFGRKDILDISQIKNIKQYSPTRFICKCHWSIVDIIIKK